VRVDARIDDGDADVLSGIGGTDGVGKASGGGFIVEGGADFAIVTDAISSRELAGRAA
jgi:hypothetical protein